MPPSNKYMSVASFPICSTIIEVKYAHMTIQSSSQKLIEIIDVKYRSQMLTLGYKNTYKIKNKYFLSIKFINNFMLVRHM